MKCELCYTKALATNTNSKSYLVRDSSFVKSLAFFCFYVHFSTLDALFKTDATRDDFVL